MMERITTHVILNSVSVSRLQKDPESVIRNALDPEKFDVSFFHTTSKGEARGLARKAVAQGATLILAAGGDGTVNEVGSAMTGTGSILGIIPVGSGNGLARSLGIPLSVRKSAEIINKMKFRTIDTGMVNDVPFFSVAGAGFDARVANRYRESKSRGFMTYLRIAAREVFRYSSRRYSIRVDGKELVRRAFLITVSNSGQFGYNTVIAPEAELDDGYLDLVIVRSIPFYRIPLLAYRLMTRSIDKEHETETFKAREIIIRREKGRRVNIDGESMKMGSLLNIRILPSSLKVIIP